ncbi:MAG: hypothetical protein Q9222_000792 [Ikaeria aurantiellina]
MFVTNTNEPTQPKTSQAQEDSVNDCTNEALADNEKVSVADRNDVPEAPQVSSTIVDFAPPTNKDGALETEEAMGREPLSSAVLHEDQTNKMNRTSRVSKIFGRLSFLPQHVVGRDSQRSSTGTCELPRPSTTDGMSEEHHASTRSSRFVARLSTVAHSLGSGRASIGSSRQSFTDSFDVEDHPSNKRMRKRDSKAIPKSWITLGISGSGVGDAVSNAAHRLHNTNFREMYEKAKVRQQKIKRSRTAQLMFKYTFYFFLVASVYLGLVGLPLWRGLVWYMYIVFQKHLVLKAGLTITFGIGFLYAYTPLLINFEPTASSLEADEGRHVGQTLEAALKIFPKQNIFVIANGNSPEPLDGTAAVCEQYDVSHTWSPLGSKVIAQFVGCYVARRFPHVLLIDDDCLLPPNFPIVSDRLRGNVKCIGYIMKATGPNGSKGTLCQQAQDLEYKLSGLAKSFAGKVGSVTFPHGCIVLWDRELLVQTFQEHPGFSVSEDWFFGHAARQLGSRIKMCTATFVETEVPSSVFFSTGGARGGFGEMTIWKQRFFRWNYFFVTGIYYDLHYIVCNWKLGWAEVGAKIFVFQEVYETLLYLLAPFVIPISFATRPVFSAYLYAATITMYIVNALIFNQVSLNGPHLWEASLYPRGKVKISYSYSPAQIHLRSRHEMVSWKAFLYYTPFKWVLGFVNIASCYYAIYTYATYFAKRHPKIIEDDKAVEIVLQMEHREMRAEAKVEIEDLNVLMGKIAKPVDGGEKARAGYGNGSQETFPQSVLIVVHSLFESFQMQSFILLTLLGLSCAAPTPQLIDTAGVEAAPAPVFITPAYNVLEQEGTTNEPVIAPRDRLHKRDGNCAPQPAGSGPVSSPDTPDAFLANSVYRELANNASTPDGYSLVMQNAGASLSASNYMGLKTLKSYDTLGCASLCDQASGCQAFNMYIERDPTVDPNMESCPNPPSLTNYKCTLWGAAVSAAEATNKGQWRDSFQVLIAGSNAYNKATPPAAISCYNGPTQLGGAINAPYNAQGQNTYMGYKYHPFSQTQGYDPSTCAADCNSQTAYNKRHPAADGSYQTCTFFNAYVLSVNAIPQGLYCSMYTQAWAASYATNYGQYRDSVSSEPTSTTSQETSSVSLSESVSSSVTSTSEASTSVTSETTADSSTTTPTTTLTSSTDTAGETTTSTSSVLPTTSDSSSSSSSETAISSLTTSTMSESTSSDLTTSSSSSMVTTTSLTTSLTTPTPTSTTSSTASTTSSSTTSTSATSSSTSTTSSPTPTAPANFCLQNAVNGQFASLSKTGNGLSFDAISPKTLPSLFTLDPSSSILTSTKTGVVAVLNLATFGKDGLTEGHIEGTTLDQLDKNKTYAPLVCGVGAGDKGATVLMCRSAANYIDPVKTPAARSMLETTTKGNDGVDQYVFAPTTVAGAAAIRVLPASACGPNYS